MRRRPTAFVSAITLAACTFADSPTTDDTPNVEPLAMIEAASLTASPTTAGLAAWYCAALALDCAPAEPPPALTFEAQVDVLVANQNGEAIDVVAVALEAQLETGAVATRCLGVDGARAPEGCRDTGDLIERLAWVESPTAQVAARTVRDCRPALDGCQVIDGEYCCHPEGCMAIPFGCFVRSDSHGNRCMVCPGERPLVIAATLGAERLDGVLRPHFEAHAEALAAGETPAVAVPLTWRARIFADVRGLGVVEVEAAPLDSAWTFE